MHNNVCTINMCIALWIGNSNSKRVTRDDWPVLKLLKCYKHHKTFTSVRKRSLRKFDLNVIDRCDLIVCNRRLVFRLMPIKPSLDPHVIYTHDLVHNQLFGNLGDKANKSFLFSTKPTDNIFVCRLFLFVTCYFFDHFF